MRVSIYAPNGAHLETIIPKQKVWSAEWEGEDIHIRLIEYPKKGGGRGDNGQVKDLWVSYCDCTRRGE
jgi:hypothetical protein